MENSNNTPPPYIGEPIPVIEKHIVLAILTRLLGWLPFGIVSIVYSVQVNSALNARNYELAKINSQKAKYWGSLALWLGLALNLIWFVFGIGGALL